MMTQELYEKCKAYEQSFRWAINSNFVHMTSSEFAKVAALYKEAFDDEVKNQNCNTCRLRALQTLGKSYFEYQQEIANEQKEERAEEPKKKKVGRPPKIDIE